MQRCTGVWDYESIEVWDLLVIWGCEESRYASFVSGVWDVLVIWVSEESRYAFHLCQVSFIWETFSLNLQTLSSSVFSSWLLMLVSISSIVCGAAAAGTPSPCCHNQLQWSFARSHLLFWQPLYSDLDRSAHPYSTLAGASSWISCRAVTYHWSAIWSFKCDKYVLGSHLQGSNHPDITSRFYILGL